MICKRSRANLMVFSFLHYTDIVFLANNIFFSDNCNVLIAKNHPILKQQSAQSENPKKCVSKFADITNKIQKSQMFQSLKSIMTKFFNFVTFI